jgi:hypothetical protein
MLAAVVLLGAGTAAAANTIGSSDIINNSVKSKDLKDNGVKSKDIRDETLQTADFSQAARDELKGEPGEDGEDGVATYANPEWGPLDRNVIGSPDQDLGGGPFVPGANGSPPFGQGSLHLSVNGVPRVANNTDSEAAAWGNQVDFAGQQVSSIQELGFHVFTTGENNAKGNPNMPNIKFEIDPNLSATPSNFSTLVYQPANTTANQWSGYIDATATGEDFFLTGAAGTATNCTQATLCDLAQIQTALNDGGDAATIGTFFVGKGRDFAWSGAVDGLRLNSTVYDFEPFGVIETSATR